MNSTLNSEASCDITLLTAIVYRAKQARKKNPKSKCSFIFMYKKSEQDLAPISMSSKEVPLTLGLIDFKEDHISFSNVDKINGIIQVILEINDEKQPYDLNEKDPSKQNNYFKIYLKDMQVDKDEQVLNWNITNDTELSIKFKMKGKYIKEEEQDNMRKRASDITMKGKISLPITQVVENKSFNIRDRLNIFDKKKNEGINKSMTIPGGGDNNLNSSPKHKSSVGSNSNSLSHAMTLSSKHSSMSNLTSAESFLEYIPKEEYNKLPKSNKDNLLARDCFCEGFFLASFPFKGGKVIEKSQSYPSICNHKQCSMLPAMQPEIIFRYPLKDTKTLELNNLAATICFPSGIKVCYEEEPPETVKNYSTPITNQQGDRYYMMTFHFYFKLLGAEYGKLYEMHPLKHHLMKFADSYLDVDKIDKKTAANIQENLDLCQDFGFRDVVYVPYCLCLISKYPYIRQMEACLQSIYGILSGFNPNSKEQINEIIMFLVHSIPIPPINTRLKFYLPNYPRSIEINCPRYKDMNILNYNLTNLLTLFSVENIITIFRLMLFEKKILFVDSEYNRLSEVTDSFISLLYPFQWIHTYIPIMSDQMIKYLETFLPFINGINEILMPFVRDTLIENEDEVYIIYIAKNQIDINLSLTGKKVKLAKKIDETTPNLPAKMVKRLTQNLNDIKTKIDESSNTSSSTNKDSTSPNSTLENIRSILDMKIKNEFIDMIVEMFHDYNKYLCSVEDDVVFNSVLLVENRPPEDSFFYKEFTETQLFQQFTQNILKDDFNYFNAMVEAFETKSQDHQKKNIDSPFKNEHTYIIKPSFIPSKETELTAFEKELGEKYAVSSSMGYENGITRENKRILARIIDINDEFYKVDECKFYVFPNTLSGNNENKKSSLIAGRAEIFESRERYNNKQKNLPRLLTKECNLSDKAKEDIKEILKDFIVRIFKSEDIAKNIAKDKKDIVQATTTSFGRDFFIKLLNKNNTNIKILDKQASSLLADIFKEILLQILQKVVNDQILEQIVLLLKTCFFYGTSVRELLWDLMCPKLYDYSLISKDDALWKKWLEVELKEKNGEGKNEIVLEILKGLLLKMLQLKVDKEFIVKTLVSYGVEKLTTVSEQERFKESVKQIVIGYEYKNSNQK